MTTGLDLYSLWIKECSNMGLLVEKHSKIFSGARSMLHHLCVIKKGELKSALFLLLVT